MSGFAAAATKPTEAVVHPLVLLNCVDHYNRVAKNTSKRVVGVYSCGPPSMMSGVRAAVQAASNTACKFYLHEENFEL